MRHEPDSLPSLSLQATGHRREQQVSPLALWHLLSLDAPCVATLWTAFVARAFNVNLQKTELAAMFLAVWIIYAADRLADARPFFVREPALHTHPEAQSLQARHLFHDEHRRAFLVALSVAVITLMVLVARLQAAQFHWLGGASILFTLWMLAVHTSPMRRRKRAAFSQPLKPARLPKELGVGFFFGVAAFLPTFIARPAMHLSILGLALGFASVCSLNCLYLWRWEHGTDAMQAHWTTRLLLPHLTIAATSTAAACALGAATSHTHTSSLGAALALSALALAALDYFRFRFTPLHLRALGDLVLLTPLLFTFFLPKTIS